MLSKEEFHLKQNVEPFIHYREKHTTFECITRENIEAVAAKVPPIGARFCCQEAVLRFKTQPSLFLLLVSLVSGHEITQLNPA